MPGKGEGANNPPPSNDPTSRPPTDPPGKGVDDPETVEAWRSKAREWEKRARENIGALKELDELKAARMTEEEKREAARQAVERERDELKAENLRIKVALAKGLPANLASRLQGATQEDLEADADALKALLNPNPTNGNQPSPRPDLGQGARGNTSPPSADAWLRGMAGRRR